MIVDAPEAEEEQRAERETRGDDEEEQEGSRRRRTLIPAPSITTLRDQSTASTALELSPQVTTHRQPAVGSSSSFLVAGMESSKVRDKAVSEALLRAPPQKLGLSFEDIRFETTKGKVLLHNVTGHVPAGEMCGILGPSGSGKTCLLDVLALRKKKGGVLREGKVLYGGRPLKAHSKGESMCYIGQEDVLIDALTVREAVSFAVRLEFGYKISSQALETLVNSILDDTGLTSSADVRIGDPYTGKGISGGQRRRLMIAVELVSCPAVMILDEPTSGLDFASAFGVMKALQTMAKTGHTVLTVVHQPSSQIWSLFDRVAFLSEGSFVYFGPPKQLITYFETLGHVCPEFYNPAEFVLELIRSTPESNTAQDSLKEAFVQSALLKEMKARIQEDIQRGKMVPKNSKEDVVLMIADADEAIIKPRSVGLLTSAAVLLHRNTIDLIRNPSILLSRWALISLIAFIMGLTYYQIGDRFNDEAIRSRASALFFLPTFTSMISMSMVPAFMHNRAVIKKEIGNGRYSVWAFALSYIVPIVFASAFISISVAIISYFMMKLRNFGLYFLVLLANYLIMEIIVLASAAVAPHYLIGMLTVVSVLAGGMATQGFFIVFNRINWSIRWLGYITPHRFMYHALLRNEFETMGNLTSVFYPTGEDYLNFYGVNNGDSLPTYWYNMLIVLCFIVVFFFTYLLALSTWRKS